MATDVTAERFIERLETLRAPVDLGHVQDFFRTDNDFLGARMGDVFNLAKEFIDMPPDEIDILLRSTVHEVRVGGLSIMGKQAARKKTPESRLKELYQLYLKRTDLIDTWDLVDLSAHHVVGRYLADKSRAPLYKLARSKKWWERRIAMFATLHFVREGDLEDTFKIGEMLAYDEHDLVQKVVGGMLREAGKKDRKRLLDFLEEHAEDAPQIVLRYAMEHLDKDTKSYYKAKRRKAAG